MCNESILGYVSGTKWAKIPWAKLCNNPSAWIKPECTPDGFQWADPSKIRIGDIFLLLDHWRDRQWQHLSLLIWVTSCPLFKNASPSLEHRQQYHSDNSTDSSSSHNDGSNVNSSDPHPNEHSRSACILDSDCSSYLTHFSDNFRLISEETDDNPFSAKSPSPNPNQSNEWGRPEEDSQMNSSSSHHENSPPDDLGMFNNSSHCWM